MLVLSTLIIFAMATAVASFFVAGAQWLLFVSAGLVIFAFYESRRSAKANRGPHADANAGPPHPVRDHLTVTVDQRILIDESGRHRHPAPPVEPGIADDDAPDEGSTTQLENGQALTG